MAKYQLPASIKYKDWMAMSEDNRNWLYKAADWCFLHPYVFFNMDHPANKGMSKTDIFKGVVRP